MRKPRTKVASSGGQWLGSESCPTTDKVWALRHRCGSGPWQRPLLRDPARSNSCPRTRSNRGLRPLFARSLLPPRWVRGSEARSVPGPGLRRASCPDSDTPAHLALANNKETRVPAALSLNRVREVRACSCFTRISDETATAHGLAIAEGLEGDAFRENLARRSAAQQAFVEADNSDAIRRALLRRSNPIRGSYNPW